MPKQLTHIEVFLLTECLHSAILSRNIAEDNFLAQNQSYSLVITHLFCKHLNTVTIWNQKYTVNLPKENWQNSNWHDVCIVHHKLYIKCKQIIHQIYTQNTSKYKQIIHQTYTNYTPITEILNTKYTPIIHKLYTKCKQVIHQLYTAANVTNHWCKSQNHKSLT